MSHAEAGELSMQRDEREDIATSGSTQTPSGEAGPLRDSPNGISRRVGREAEERNGAGPGRVLLS